MTDNNDFGGAAAAREAQARQAAQFAGGDTWKYELGSIFPGESIVVRFGGGSDPAVIDFHGFSRMPGGSFDKLQCCASPNSDCDACRASVDRNEKRVKPRSPRGFFTVYSTRQGYLVPQQSAAGTSYTKFEPIHRDPQGNVLLWDKQSQRAYVSPGNQHPLATGQYPVAEEGLKILSGSLAKRAKQADEILELAARLRSRCCCGRPAGIDGYASIRVASYACAACGQPVAYDPKTGHPVTCMACRQTTSPRELLACSVTDPPCPVGARRAGIGSCYVRITRTGSGTDTGYSYEALPFSDPLPQHAAVLFKDGKPNLFDYANIYKPNRVQMAAALAARGIVFGQQQPGQHQVPGVFGQPPTSPFGGPPPFGGFQQPGGQSVPPPFGGFQQQPGGQPNAAPVPAGNVFGQPLPAPPAFVPGGTTSPNNPQGDDPLPL